MEKINSHLVMSCAMSKIKYFPVFPAIVKEISIQYLGNVSNKGSYNFLSKVLEINTLCYLLLNVLAIEK